MADECVSMIHPVLGTKAGISPTSPENYMYTGSFSYF